MYNVCTIMYTHIRDRERDRERQRERERERERAEEDTKTHGPWSKESFSILTVTVSKLNFIFPSKGE